MASLLGKIRKLNGMGDRSIEEPFCGGAGASLSLLFREEAPLIRINDRDAAIHDFWWALLHRSDEFLEFLDRTPVSIREWHRQREIYRSKARISRVRRGFAAFYLNRCNRSGIIMNGGPIGGLNQTGEYKIDVRFNKTELRTRCEKIFEYSDRIRVSSLDGLAFIDRAALESSFLFIDAPYFEKGGLLYLNILNCEYHSRLAEKLKSTRDLPWVATYDDCDPIRELYSGWANVRPFSLRYSAAEKRNGRELFISPRWMQLPGDQSSGAITW